MILHLMTKWSNILGDFRLHFLLRNWPSCCRYLTHSQSRLYWVWLCSNILFFLYLEKNCHINNCCLLSPPSTGLELQKVQTQPSGHLSSDYNESIVQQALWKWRLKRKEKIEEFTVAYSNDRFERLSKFDSFRQGMWKGGFTLKHFETFPDW